MASLTPRLDRLDLNYLINAGLDFWQRSQDLTLDNFYVADRMKCRAVDAAAALSRNARVRRDLADLPSVNGISASAIVSTTTANTTRIGFGQFVEQKVARDLSNKEVTVSFYVRRISTENAAIRLKVSVASLATPDSTTNRFISDGGIEFENESQVFNSLPTAWTRISHTFTASANMAANGFLFTVRAEGPGLANLTVLTNGDLFKVTGMMVQQGDNLSDFVRATSNIAEELALCQRYYEKSYNTDVNPGTITGVGKHRYTSGGSFADPRVFRLHQHFLVSKRTLPTMIGFSPASGTSGQISKAGPSTLALSDQAVTFEDVATSGFNFGASVDIVNTMDLHWTADADF